PAPGETVDLSDAYRVIADEFVSLSDGTGIVHIAPAYGDLEIGRKYGLPTLFSVDLAGNVLPELAKYGIAGMFFKRADARSSKIFPSAVCSTAPGAFGTPIRSAGAVRRRCSTTPSRRGTSGRPRKRTS